MLFSSATELLLLLLMMMMMMMMITTMMTAGLHATSSECSGYVTRYMTRHVDVSYEVLANYVDGEAMSSSPRLRGRFNLTNRGTTAVQRGNWEIYMSSLRLMQFNDNGTMLGNSGLKARIISEYIMQSSFK